MVGVKSLLNSKSPLARVLSDIAWFRQPSVYVARKSAHCHPFPVPTSADESQVDQVGTCDPLRMVSNSRQRGHFPAFRRSDKIRAASIGARHRLAVADSRCPWLLLLSCMEAPSPRFEQRSICSTVELPNRLLHSSSRPPDLAFCAGLRESKASTGARLPTKFVHDERPRHSIHS